MKGVLITTADIFHLSSWEALHLWWMWKTHLCSSWLWEANTKEVPTSCKLKSKKYLYKEIVGHLGKMHTCFLPVCVDQLYTNTWGLGIQLAKLQFMVYGGNYFLENNSCSCKCVQYPEVLSWLPSLAPPCLHRETKTCAHQHSLPRYPSCVSYQQDNTLLLHFVSKLPVCTEVGMCHFVWVVICCL